MAIPVIVVSLCWLIFRLVYLLLCVWIVRYTGRTSGLRDLAEALRALNHVSRRGKRGPGG